VTYFVKMLGASDMPLANEPWSEREINEEVRFLPKPPPTDVSRGDELLYYAVGGSKRIFAAAYVEEAPALNHLHKNPVIGERYPYASPVTVPEATKLQYVSSGPELSAVGGGLQSQIRGGVSHFEIGKREFDRALVLLRRAKDDEDRKIASGWRP
jgi:hypothetical protein